MKTRTEFETEKILNMHRAKARKRQIQLLKDELELHQPLCTQSYTITERRKPLLKIMWSIVVEVFRLPLELLP